MYQENITALKKDAPIGVFDSGIGGLTVAREIMRQIPNEKIIYFGDTARMPYGSKSRETVAGFSKQIVRFLETFQVKTIVVACNTASAYALDELEKELDIPKLTPYPGISASASEDFANIAEQVPSAFMYLSAGYMDDRGKYSAHNPKVQFNEDVCPIGAACLAHCATRYLNRFGI